jgi:hypothetical protein
MSGVCTEVNEYEKNKNKNKNRNRNNNNNNNNNNNACRAPTLEHMAYDLLATEARASTE